MGVGVRCSAWLQEKVKGRRFPFWEHTGLSWALARGPQWWQQQLCRASSEELHLRARLRQNPWGNTEWSHFQWSVIVFQRVSVLSSQWLLWAVHGECRRKCPGCFSSHQLLWWAVLGQVGLSIRGEKHSPQGFCKVRIYLPPSPKDHA